MTSWIFAVNPSSFFYLPKFKYGHFHWKKKRAFEKVNVQDKDNYYFIRSNSGRHFQHLQLGAHSCAIPWVPPFGSHSPLGKWQITQWCLCVVNHSADDGDLVAVTICRLQTRVAACSRRWSNPSKAGAGPALSFYSYCSLPQLTSSPSLLFRQCHMFGHGKSILLPPLSCVVNEVFSKYWFREQAQGPA